MNLICPHCDSALNEETPTISALLTACDDCLNPVLIIEEDSDYTVTALKGIRDIRRMAPPESIGGQLLKKLKPCLNELPVFPEISQRILAALDGDDVSMKNIGDIVREDAAVSAKVLQAANSALYGGLEQITAFDAACTRLGTRTLGDIVHTIASGPVFECKDEASEETLNRLHSHSIATAFCAGEVAKLVSAPSAGMLYLSGLFHDIGKVVLLQCLSRSPKKITSMLEKSPELLHEILNNFHNIVGLHIVKKWELPNEFRICTYYHEHVGDIPIKEWFRNVHVIALANKISTISGFGATDSADDISLLDHPSAQFLSMTDIKLAMLRVDVEEKFSELLDSLAA